MGWGGLKRENRDSFFMEVVKLLSSVYLLMQLCGEFPGNKSIGIKRSVI